MEIEMKKIIALALWFVFSTTSSFASDSEMLTRAEVGGLKKKLTTIFAAMGQPPEGYVVEKETFNLPTETRKIDGKYDWVSPAAEFRIGSGQEKAARKVQNELETAYQKKVAEALAKGDYQAMTKISQEVQQKAAQMQAAAIEGRKEPLSLNINLNTHQSETIDPDSVVFEKPGVIALLIDKNDELHNRLVVYFDPIVLKSTETLSRIDFERPEQGVSEKTAVVNATIELTGPGDEVTAWAKRIDTAAVLSQIGRR
jgi:hypothetical protein